MCGYRRCGVFVSEVSFFTFSFGSVRADPFLLDHPVYVNQTRIIAVSNLTQSFRYEDGGGMSWMVSASAYKNILCHPEDHSRVPLPVVNTVAARCSETSVAVCTRLHGVEDGTVAQAYSPVFHLGGPDTSVVDVDLRSGFCTQYLGCLLSSLHQYCIFIHIPPTPYNLGSWRHR